MKLLDLDIINILKEKTNDKNTLTQAKIRKELEKLYDKNPPAKNTLREHLRCLVDKEESGIKCKKYNRNDMEELYTDFYFEHSILDEELRYLVDCVLYSKEIETSQAQKLVENIIGLSGRELKKNVNYICNFKTQKFNLNKDTLKNVEKIQGAINKQKKIKFKFNTYGSDKKLHPLWGNKEVAFSPFQIVMNNGRYYLMASTDNMIEKMKYHLYKINLITDLVVLKDKAEDKKIFNKIPYGMNLYQQMMENPYMFLGEARDVELRVNRDSFNYIIEWFGDSFTIISDCASNKTVDIKIKVNPQSLKYWLLQYGECVEVLDENLRKEMKKTLSDIGKKYNN